MAHIRKLQVFVSSTYTDLIKERQTAVEAILLSGHIPAGMELFSAGDKSQMEVIKNWIDESDVYLLLVGGRYGSTDPESGKSYTQLEYEYAIEKGKPSFALIITDEHLDEKIKTLGKEILELENPQKLRDFKALVKTKIVKFWNSEDSIKLSILQKLNELVQRSDLIGWIRGEERKVFTKSHRKERTHDSKENSTNKPQRSFQEHLLQTIQSLDKPKDGLSGVPSGFMALDRVINGWQSSQLIVLAARPGMGKSIFVISMLRNIAVEFNIPVALFSFEMSNEQVVARLISNHCEIETDKIIKNRLKPEDYSKMHLKMKSLEAAPFYIEDSFDISIDDIRTRCYQLKAEYNIKIIVIDYLQLISNNDESKNANDNVSITSILRTLRGCLKFHKK